MTQTGTTSRANCLNQYSQIYSIFAYLCKYFECIFFELSCLKNFQNSIVLLWSCIEPASELCELQRRMGAIEKVHGPRPGPVLCIFVFKQSSFVKDMGQVIFAKVFLCVRLRGWLVDILSTVQLQLQEEPVSFSFQDSSCTLGCDKSLKSKILGRSLPADVRKVQ